jgi:hypothetical protein
MFEEQNKKKKRALIILCLPNKLKVLNQLKVQIFSNRILK